MKKIILPIVLVVAVLPMLGIGYLWWFQKKSVPEFFAQDAVRIIATGAGELFEQNPTATDDDVARMVKSLHEASVINLEIDSDGKAVDPFGTPFRVENRIEAGKSTTTVTSAGPDREFGTRDDISSTAEQSGHSID